MARTKSVAFRVTSEELDALRGAAAADRRILSDWLRIVALDAAATRQVQERSIFDPEAQ